MDPSHCDACGRDSQITIETREQSKAGTFCLDCAAEHISKHRAMFAFALLSIIRSGVPGEVDSRLLEIRDLSTTA